LFFPLDGIVTDVTISALIALLAVLTVFPGSSSSPSGWPEQFSRLSRFSL
jgi:hypothetical protein